MRYKVGDKVRIKTWEEMEWEFELNSYGEINTPDWFYLQSMEKQLKKLNTDRVVTIKDIIYETYIRMRGEI